MIVDASQQLTPNEFERFRALIFRLSGIQVPESKVMLLSNRIRRRVKATGVADFKAYLDLLQAPQGCDELDGFLNVVTTNETSFFRTEKQFDWLQTEFVDGLREQVRQGQHPKQIRLWSAASSSGEEAYTMALCLAEHRVKLLGWTIEIHGTDISEQCLAKARTGVFGPQIVEQVPEKLLTRYFRSTAEGKSWEAKSPLKDWVSFSRHNLMEPNPQRNYDCIFLRNVMIYFSRESKQVVINHLVDSLAMGGYLVLGPSEGVFDLLGMLQRRSPFLYQKVDSRGPTWR